MLSEVGVDQGIEEARNIMGGRKITAASGADYAAEELSPRQSRAAVFRLLRESAPVIFETPHFALLR